MPHHRACAKHLRATAKRNVRNRAARSTLRTAIKNVRQATDKTDATDKLKTAFSVIDKTAKHGIIHANQAANQKAKLSRVVQRLGS